MQTLTWSTLSKLEFIESAKELVRQDLDLSLKFIDMLMECEIRMLYLEEGYSSLWDWATRFLGLSESSAQIRISAMRLSREISEVKPALEAGTLSLSNAAQLNRFFREEKKLGQDHSSDSKKEIVRQMSGLSKRECEKKLFEISPSAVPLERERVVSASQVEIKIILTEAEVEQLKQLKDLLAHTLSSGTGYGELFIHLAKEKLERLKKQKEGEARAPRQEGDVDKNEDSLCPEKVNESSSPTPLTLVPAPREYIPVDIRRAVWSRAGSQCEYVSESKTRCLSKHALELDHRVPLILGGRSDFENLRILCKNHNLQQAVEKLGPEWMGAYVKSVSRYSPWMVPKVRNDFEYELGKRPGPNQLN